METAPVDCTTSDYIEPEYGPGGVPKGSKTEEYYRTNNIPARFNNPGTYIYLWEFINFFLDFQVINKVHIQNSIHFATSL